MNITFNDMAEALYRLREGKRFSYNPPYFLILKEAINKKSLGGSDDDILDVDGDIVD